MFCQVLNTTTLQDSIESWRSHWLSTNLIAWRWVAAREDERRAAVRKYEGVNVDRGRYRRQWETVNQGRYRRQWETVIEGKIRISFAL
jgi:hypothetical protein